MLKRDDCKQFNQLLDLLEKSNSNLLAVLIVLIHRIEQEFKSSTTIASTTKETSIVCLPWKDQVEVTENNYDDIKHSI